MKKEYQVIYADPPWRYEHVPMGNPKNAIEIHYPTMDLEDIKNLEISTAKDSILFLWATAPKLEEALQVMNAWGFRYRTCMVWDKLHIGLGYWFRNRHELLLVGIKGNFPTPNPKLRVSSVLRIQRTKHSKKPNRIRAWIKEWYPDKTKIELFARQRFEGWDVWGNEVPNYIQRSWENAL